MARIRATQEADTTRPVRMSVREQRNKLTVHGLDDKNFYYRWVIDKDDRLAIFLRAGYTFVQKTEVPAQFIGDWEVETSKGTDSRLTRSMGGGKMGWLMKLPLDIRSIYEAEKEADILETERSMRRSKSQSAHQAAQDAEIVNVQISSTRGREALR